MSLINEALRKARQAASEHDAKQEEDLFRPRKAYPSRRAGGGGWMVTGMIAVVAGVIGASAAWWFFGDRQTAPIENPVAEVRAPDTEVPVTAPVPSPTALDEPSLTESAGAAAIEASTPRPPRPVEASPDVQVDPKPPVTEPPPTEVVVSEPAETTGERDFVMEADLGGVVLSLGFIVARVNNPFAEINGIEVYVGSEIEGFVVEAIEADRVVLRDDAGPLILRVP